MRIVSIRFKVESASGFQSSQFREFEFILGNKRAAAIDRYPQGSPERIALAARMNDFTLWQSFLRRLKHVGHAIPNRLIDTPMQALPETDAELQEILLDIYHNHPNDRMLCELMVDLDEGIQEWRYRHVKMVERTIGARMGTGGSPGAAYLRATLFTPLFTDLWTIRDRI